MRILSLITHYSHVPQWEESTINISRLDPAWVRRNLIAKAWKLVCLSDQFDIIVFFYDTRLAMLFWLLRCLRRNARPRPSYLFTTFLCDVYRFSRRSFLSRWGVYEMARWVYYAMFARIMDTIIVHSSAEVQLYGTSFRVSPGRFKFIPYCVRADALDNNHSSNATVEGPYAVVAGRNRDIATFVAALKGTQFRGVMVVGEADRIQVPLPLPSNVEVHFEVPFREYRAWIEKAKVLVVPLSRERLGRSLGQVATLEAVAKHVPVIAARTFQLADYFEDGREILFYESENPEDLRRKIERVMTETDLGQRLTLNAYRRMMLQYTDRHYTAALLRTCLS